MRTDRQLSTASVLVLALHCSAIGVADESRIDASKARQSDICALKQLEESVTTIVPRVMPAVVAVNSASGVIISETGLVLSQYHVTHSKPGRPYKDSFDPGHPVDIVFADGRKSRGHLLGADRVCDLSLVKLEDPGPYPFVHVDPKQTVGLGDWVLKPGHPTGYRPGRKPVVRLGRVVCRIETERVSEFITDCDLTGGDSGGPFFNLDGHLVGIIGTRVSVPGVEVPPSMAPRVLSTWAVTTAPRTQEKMELMLRGELTESQVRQYPAIYATAETLDVDRWRHGRETLRPWHAVIGDARRSVVRILDDQVQTALGTVVDDQGTIITRASRLPSAHRCLSHDGREISTVLLGVEKEFDIAILRTTDPLPALPWSLREVASVGTLLVAPGSEARRGSVVPAVGVVSVATRDLAGPYLENVSYAPRPAADPPEIRGIPIEGRGLVVVSVDGQAALCGLEPADELTHLGATSIRTEDDLSQAVRGYRRGDPIRATFLRGSKLMEVNVTLDSPGQQRATKRRGHVVFPRMFEHDAPVSADEFGGPVLDLDGKMLGISLARIANYGTAAVDWNTIRGIVDQYTQSSVDSLPARATHDGLP